MTENDYGLMKSNTKRRKASDASSEHFNHTSNGEILATLSVITKKPKKDKKSIGGHRLSLPSVTPSRSLMSSLEKITSSTKVAYAVRATKQRTHHNR